MRGAWIEIILTDAYVANTESLPMRGAWIEMTKDFVNPCLAEGRSPCGERGLKSYRLLWKHWEQCRSPCGERGLKSVVLGLIFIGLCRSPCGERGLKLIVGVGLAKGYQSLPMRGVWIEILLDCLNLFAFSVAPHAGSVD